MFARFSVKVPTYVGVKQSLRLRQLLGRTTGLPNPVNAKVEQVVRIEFDNEPT